MANDREFGELSANVKMLLDQNKEIFEWIKKQAEICEAKRMNCQVKQELKEHKEGHWKVAGIIIAITGAITALILKIFK